MSNPFHASFGVSPPLLVGRDGLLEDFVEALEDGPGASGRAALYTGARGSGKTVMLNAVEDRTKERGWLVTTEEQAGRYQAWFDNARRLREAITQLEATSLRTLQDTEGWQPKIRDN
jgi:Flp pilus assembly CpaF family ATPase